MQVTCSYNCMRPELSPRFFFKFYALIQHDPVKVLATQLSVYRGSKVPVSLLISSSLSVVSQHPQETYGAVILKDTHTSGCLKKLSHSDPLVSSSVKQHSHLSYRTTLNIVSAEMPDTH